MKRLPFILLMLCVATVVHSQYVADELGKSFVKRTIAMPNDYEGRVVCTLVKHTAPAKSKRAVLYVHGYNDYFYQAEMAERFTKAGYRFYAIDLRKYGRSLLPGQNPNNARDLHEYVADIDTANSIIRSEGATHIVLIGHSMGGLVTALYASEKGKRLKFDAMILNAPFFDFNENWFNEQIAVPTVSFLGRFFPDLIIPAGTSTAYVESIHRNYHGEWRFDLKKKLPASGDKHWCWIRAIHLAHLTCQKGLNMPCPTLTLCSDHSVRTETWSPALQTADGVLDVKDIQHYARLLGPKAELAIFPGGMHDLVLSKKNVREAVYRKMFDWLSKH